MKIFKIVSLLTFYSIMAISLNGQSIDYTVQNKCDSISPLKIGLNILGLENIFGPVTTGLSVDIRPFDRLFINGQVRVGYIESFLDFNKSMEKLKQFKMASLNLEGGVDFALLKWTRKGNFKVDYSSSYGSSSYFKAKVDAKRMISASGGAFNYSRNQSFVNYDYEYVISGGNSFKLSEGDEQNFFPVNSTVFFAGLSYIKIRKGRVNFEGRSQKFFMLNKFYLHALFGYTATGKYDYNGTEYTIDNAKQMKPVSYRIGWFVEENYFSAGLEFGFMPKIYLDTPELPAIEENFYPDYFKFVFNIDIFGSDNKYKMN